MAAPYLIIGCGGDSNGMWGKYRDTNIDVGHARIFQYTQTEQIVAATEPLNNLGYGEVEGHKVGSTLALCRLIIERGKLPDGYDILIVPHFWAGTAFPNYWATTGDRNALDGGAGDGIGILAHLASAMATHADNLMWFFSWEHGLNDVNMSQTDYQNHMIATWTEIRETVATASKCPLLVVDVPPISYDPELGGFNMTGVRAAQQNIGNVLADSIYVSGLGRNEIDSSSDYKHYTAASHRGGVNDAPDNLGEVVSVDDSLAGRKYQALFGTPRWRRPMQWGGA